MKPAGGKWKEVWRLGSFQQRLAETLQQLRIAKRGYLPLETAIREAFQLPAGHKALLSRKQLQKIAEGKDIPLRLEQLDLLDRFLRRHGKESLADMLSPPSVLRFMAEEGKIGFIVGSQPNWEDCRIELSRWDIKAMQSNLEGLFATGKPLQVVIEDVILREQEDAKVFQDAGPVLPSEDWYNLVGDLDLPGQSLIVLGSPRVNHGAEKVLAAMLGVKPFEPWPAERIGERPFAFFWRNPLPEEKKVDRPVSCLDFAAGDDCYCVRGEDDSWRIVRSASPPAGDAVRMDDRQFLCGIVVNGRFYPTPDARAQKLQKWSSYAIIAARRGTYRTCACICGATGPATLGAARAFEEFVPRRFKPEGSGRVAWCLVKVEVEVRDEPKSRYRADKRRLGGYSIMLGNHCPPGEA